ncbi:hypothetical protein BASA62_004954 [Batrachochytrium salamandrivorans]|nr:hypothetical protein BASA62_004954 [Batrachochytrium salamandrivorans]
MTSPNNYTITLKLDLDFQTTFHVVERGWSAGLASIYMSVYKVLVNCRLGMKLSVFHRTFPSATPVPLLIPALADVAIVSSEASAEAPIEVPTEAACSAVESAFSPAVAAQAMVSVFDCDVVASSLAPSTDLAPHSYDKPFWERSSRRKVVALPSLHMAMVDYNDWLITYDSRGSVVFQPRETVV